MYKAKNRETGEIGIILLNYKLKYKFIDIFVAYFPFIIIFNSSKYLLTIYNNPNYQLKIFDFKFCILISKA